MLAYIHVSDPCLHSYIGGKQGFDNGKESYATNMSIECWFCQSLQLLVKATSSVIVVLADSRLDNRYDDDDNENRNADRNDDAHLHVFPPEVVS